MNKKSFTLIEVLIFVTIISLFFVVASAVAITSVRNIKINANKILATRYAEELAEWLRAQKEIDTEAFFIHSGQSYCFSASPISAWPPPSSCGSTYALNQLFQREVTFSTIGPEQLDADIWVRWSEAGTPYSVQLEVNLATWE